MGAPLPGMDAAEQPSADTLLDSFGAMEPAERGRHVAVLDYWLSIRGERDFPAIRDLDPLEMSDAAADSLLLELAGGGEDADIRHIGEALAAHGGVDKISEAARPSLLACIAAKLGIVAISRNFLAFEDEFATPDGPRRCWITLLPFSSTGAWVDFVYGFVSLDSAAAEAIDSAAPQAPAAELEEATDSPIAAEAEADVVEEAIEAAAEPEAVAEAIEAVPEPEAVAAEPEPDEGKRPGFSKIFDAIAGVGGFYGTHASVEPTLPAAPAASEPEEPAVIEPLDEPETAEAADEPEPIATPEEPIAAEPAEQPAPAMEGHLQTKLAEVRAKAEEARQAKLRSNQALYEGLGAAYDFALDAEDSPEEYLRLVEAQGLKIQLRSPMTPVMRLAFDGLCDESMIGQLEAVLAWALSEELPRGALAGRIEAAGGIAPLLTGQAEAA